VARHEFDDDPPCIEADVAMKERALARLRQPDPATRRYRAPDSLLKFLKQL
jgi:hypothetical protein